MINFPFILFIVFPKFSLNCNSILRSRPPIPPGFSLRALDKDAPYINDFNDHQPFMDGKTVNHLLRDCVEHLPSAGLFDQGGNLVAYIMTNGYGTPGKLFVLPEFRRRGFATYLVAHLSNRLMKEGYLDKSLITAYRTNVKSIACFKRVGYVNVPNSERKSILICDK